MKRFSLVSTVFNEIERLDKTIDDIERQSVPPSEIVITDAGSTDGTHERLLDWSQKSIVPVKIFRRPGCSVAEGRNFSILNSRYDIIVSTDFGCRYHPDWLKSLTDPFINVDVLVTGGAYMVNEEEIDTLAGKANFLITYGYKITLNDRFIPSSRSIAYRKKIWVELDGYPEKLTYAADDQVFGERIRSRGIRIHLVTDPFVYWSRHKTTQGYCRESFRYGYGDGEAGINRRNALSNLIEILLRYFFIIGIILLFANFISGQIPDTIYIIIIPAAAGLRSYFRTFNNWLHLRSSKYSFNVFFFALFLIEATRINYLAGYFYGWMRRRFNSKIIQKQPVETGYE
jgi:glycosyltransferase involved in cell wall biosynthesis